MTIIDIIFLISAAFFSAIAIALLIGGIMTFQDYNPPEQKKASFLEIADGLLFHSFFTALFHVVQNWSDHREGRHYLYAFVFLIVVAIGLACFAYF